MPKAMDLILSVNSITSNKKIFNFYKKVLPDIIILLGDRYEILAMANVATIYKIPTAHIHEGEATEGLLMKL